MAGSGASAAGDQHLTRLATGWMLTITPELNLVSGLLTVLAAVLSERAVWFDDALTRGVRALRC